MDKVYKIDGGITAPIGFKAAGLACGIKESGSKDLAMIFSVEPCSAAGVFTTNKIKAAPLILTELHLERGIAQAIICNSGNANACTGPGGHADAAEMVRLTAAELGIDSESVVVASTGIIGEKLPVERIKAGITSICKLLDDTPEAGTEAALAIMTTDKEHKTCAFEFETPEGFVKVGGIAKGSGMIAPNMATMLAFLTTDAKISAPVLKEVFGDSVDESFNSIIVDSMSTNDMAIIMANGLSGIKIADAGPEYEMFKEAVRRVCETLAHMIIKDAEGATKVIEIAVEGAVDNDGARKIARAIGHCNLVKTAIYGNDPNWGRILAAAGSAGIRMNPCMTSLWINGEQILDRSLVLDFDRESVRALMDVPEVKIRLDCRVGTGSASIMTCDLTEEYIRINARYHT